MAHYDSVPFGPGAADDGAGVVTLLETARALKAGPPLKNDVIFLFTDGEEAGGGGRGRRSCAAPGPTRWVCSSTLRRVGRVALP